MRLLLALLFSLSASAFALDPIPAVESAQGKGETSKTTFRSVVTAENLDLANTAEFPANPALHPAGGKESEKFWLSLLGIRGARDESRGGWQTGATEKPERYLRVAFKEALPVGTLIGGGGTLSFLKAEAPFPGDVTDNAQWETVPLPEGQAGMRVWTFPPGVVTRALRFSFAVSPMPGKTSQSGIRGALILAERLHNLSPEAEAFASSEFGNDQKTRELNQAKNLISDAGLQGYQFSANSVWQAAPAQDVSPEHPQWVVLFWPKAKRFSGVGFNNPYAKEIEIDALNAEESGHPAAAPESSWSKIGALTVTTCWRPAYSDFYVPFATPVATRALRVRIVKTLSNENPDIVSQFERNPKDRNRLVSLGGVLAFTDLAGLPVPPRRERASEPPPIKVAYTMPYDGKVTLAINDAKGRRVRNLIATVDQPAGKRTEPWDGRDDAGNLVAPGTYTVKGITHQPLHLTYQGTVNVSGNPPWLTSWNNQHGPGGWLSDHAAPNDVMAMGDKMFVSALIAEAGHGILACDLDGNKLWGEHRFGSPKGLVYAGYLAQTGGKVYTAGMGWGAYMGITEIDPTTFSSRGNFIRLDFGNGDAAPGEGVNCGLSGMAAREGKLYVTFNHPPLSWMVRSGVNTAKVDGKQTTTGELNLEQMLALLRARDEISREAWRTAESADPIQHLRLAFTEPQAVGTLILPDAVEVSALRAEAAYPGDLDNESQWIPFAVASGALRVLTAPPGQASTRALRFTFRNAGGKPWRGTLRGAHLLPRRFENVTDGATFMASSGKVGADGTWQTVQEKPITPETPATLVVTWPEKRTWRGLALLGAFAKRIIVDEYTGASNVAPASAPESAWKVVGELSPAVRWRPMYSDDYFDAGRDVTTRAIRLRVVEPWVNENPDIAGSTGGKPTRAGLGGLIVLKHAGENPQYNEIPVQRISIADIATGKWERHVAVPEPSWPTFDPQGRLLLVSQKRVVRFDLATGATAPVLPDGAVADPRGVAFDSQGNLYVADGGPEVVKVFAANGKLLRTIGEPGGRQLGDYNRNRIENPHGIAIDAGGNLWVTESDFQPKRTSVWSPEGKFLKEFIGPSLYGGGGFIDPLDKSRLYYQGMEFAFNWESGEWKVQRILARDQPAFKMNEATRAAEGVMKVDHPVYLNGRQYMVNDPHGGGTHLLLIGEFRKDRVVPLTVVGNAEDWGPFREDPALRRLVADRPLNTLSFIWSDQNGDGLPQPGEVELIAPEKRLNATYWPTRVNNRLELQLGGRVLKPVAFTACGAPVYKPLDASPLELPVKNIYATAVDKQGGVLINGDPVTGLDSDGHVAWTYPQHWVGVHGSQRSPLPKPGQMIGGLGFVGQEDIPGVGETFMINSNVGDWFLFTADGLLAATLWHDARIPGVLSWSFPVARRGMSLDNVFLDGEHFGGGYYRTDDGKFYLVAGKAEFSLVELGGLETMKRQESTLTLTKDDLAAAELWHTRQAVAAATTQAAPKALVLAAPPAPVQPDGDLKEWKTEQFTALAKRGAFAVSADDRNLYVAWRVDSGQPLRNAGEDPSMLFKTGDSVDLQIGVDAKADPKRPGPVPGDQRLLITLMKGKPVGVLYRHRVPGTKEAARVGFSSPDRTEYVDQIDRLDTANIGIKPMKGGYAVEAVVPLTVLGLKPQPGKSYKIDFGILSADSSGSRTQVRTYWANQNTGLVSDVPGEIMLTPGLWGDVTFGNLTMRKQ
jgi:hypothetical protein